MTDFCISFGSWVCSAGNSFQSYANLGSLLDPRGERGLLGIAFDPSFASNRFVYFFITASNGVVRRNTVLRYTEAANGTIDHNTRSVILEMEAVVNFNHNGGRLEFGPDGKLYVAHGDGGGTFGRTNAQTISNTFGKILRINSDGTIPSDNPFFGQASGIARAILHMGLRNPYYLEFVSSNAMVIHDVGEVSWEEVNVGRLDISTSARRGAPVSLVAQNFGWPANEGPVNCQNPTSVITTPTCPYFGYSHSFGCAITGGARYAPLVSSFPAQYHNAHFFSDYCAGKVWYVALNTTVGASTSAWVEFATGFSLPVALAVEPGTGRLFVLQRSALVEISIAQIATTVASTTTIQETTTAVVATTVAPETTPASGYCQSPDINSDGLVNIFDIVDAISAWGSCPEGLLCRTDINCDGSTDVRDIVIIIMEWTM